MSAGRVGVGGWHNMRGPSVLIKKVTSELSSQERISEYLILELMLIKFLIKTDNLFQKWRSGYFGVCFERRSISIIMGPVCPTHLSLPCQPGLSIQSSAIGNVCTSSLHSCHRWLHFHSSSAADVAQSLQPWSHKWALEVCLSQHALLALCLCKSKVKFGGFTKA